MIYELFKWNSRKEYADIAQSVERILGKDEVTGSNPVISSKKEPIIDTIVSVTGSFLCLDIGLINMFRFQQRVHRFSESDCTD